MYIMLHEITCLRVLQVMQCPGNGTNINYAKHYNGIRERVHYGRVCRSLGDAPAVAGNVAEPLFGLMKTESFQELQSPGLLYHAGLSTGN